MKRLARAGAVAGLGIALALPPVDLMAASATGAFTLVNAEEVQLARGRGGGGRGGGGRAGGGSRGGGRSSRSGGRTGFSSYGGGGSSYRGSQRPSGGWSSGSGRGSRQDARQSTRTDRSSTRQDRAGTRQETRSDRVSDRADQRRDRADDRRDRASDRVDDRRDRIDDRADFRRDRYEDRRDRIDNRWDNYWSGWARPGWRAARPWVGGWYGGWNSWGWWGARSVAWGLGALATGAIITDLVDDAINDQRTYIVVPDTSYQLYYTSVQPSGSDAVSFAVDTGSGVVQMTADCRQGTLNGRVPATAAEAQLLNAACEVAYGD
ncbi:MAG: hypothetical protein VKI81_04445 [Synechococcaceae cyanobacterium]|nr:hypothetical protein [Synechococcaceae cyanobacterium]